MMNYIWAGMLLLGVLFAFSFHTLDAFSEGLMASCENSIFFLLKLAGLMAMWSGLMNIAQESGMIKAAARLARPATHALFSRHMQSKTETAILMSFAANLFGAGSSSTIFALRAMEEMNRENRGDPAASNDMCMFLAINMSMVQLLPVAILKIRMDAGSTDPGDILLPSFLAGIFSMLVSIWVCKLYERKDRL